MGKKRRRKLKWRNKIALWLLKAVPIRVICSRKVECGPVNPPKKLDAHQQVKNLTSK
jgi:hypothetical protein